MTNDNPIIKLSKSNSNKYVKFCADVIKKENDKPIIKASTPNSNKYDAKIDIYTAEPKGPHETIHIAVDTGTKTAHIIDTTDGPTEHTDVGCYLTTACMRHYNENFNDNCEELSILRWFRDNFVSKDILIFIFSFPI